MILDRKVEKFKSRKTVQRKYWSIIVIHKDNRPYQTTNPKNFLDFFIFGIDFL